MKTTKKLGKAKLCINRVPIPNDPEKFYVGAMKCIPVWERCDMCVCGTMSKGGEKGKKDATCIYKYGRSSLSTDDRVDIDCRPKGLKKYKVDGHTFKAFKDG